MVQLSLSKKTHCTPQSESLTEETCATIRWCTSLTVHAGDLRRRQKKEREREGKLALPIMK